MKKTSLHNVCVLVWDVKKELHLAHSLGKFRKLVERYNWHTQNRSKRQKRETETTYHLTKLYAVANGQMGSIVLLQTCTSHSAEPAVQAGEDESRESSRTQRQQGR